MKKIFSIGAVLAMLLPAFAYANFNTFNVTDALGSVLLPGNGLTYTFQPSTRLESFTVSGSQMTFTMSAGSILELKSLDRSNFVVHDSPCAVETTCSNSASTLLIQCSGSVSQQAISVTIDGTCSGSSGSGNTGSSGGAGGGGPRSPTPPPEPPPAPVALPPLPAPVANWIPSFARQLGLGMKGTDVKALKELLKSLGYLPATVVADNTFDKATEAALKKLQKVNGLAQVGRVGPQTLKLLNSGNIIGAPASAPAKTPEASSSQGFSKLLSAGSQGDEVKRLQEKLQDLGFFPRNVTPNGNFGPATQAAVKKFQKANGIAQVGYVGVNTRKALNGQ